MSQQIRGFQEQQLGSAKQCQVLTKTEVVATLTAKVAAERAINRHLRQKVSNQRQQLRRLQALYNAFLIGSKSSAGLRRLERAVVDYDANVAKITPASTGEVPAPTAGLMTEGRRMESVA